MEKVRLGFVGVGGMGQCAHLRNYVALPDCEVVALAELRIGLGQRVAARYGIPKVYKDHREMLANERLDGILAIQPFGIHGQLIPELLEAGVPVLTEKPLARNAEAGARVAEAAGKGKGRLYIGYHKRSDPATLVARQQIEEWQSSNEVGKMRYIRITMPPGEWTANGFLHLLRSDEPYPTLAQDASPADMDEATAKRLDSFVNYYIHQVNLLRFLFGEGYRVLFADPTGVVLVAQSESGVAGTLEMAPYSTTRDWQETVLIAFEKGTIYLELPAPLVENRAGKVTIFEDPGGNVTPRTLIPTLPQVHAMRQQAIHFVQAVRGEETPLCGPEDALADLQIAHDYIHLMSRMRAGD